MHRPATLQVAILGQSGGAAAISFGRHSVPHCVVSIRPGLSVQYDFNIKLIHMKRRTIPTHCLEGFGLVKNRGFLY